MKNSGKEKFSIKQVILMFTIVFTGITVISYGEVIIPNIFSSGETISSSEVNDNFTAVKNQMPAVKTEYAGFNIPVSDSFSHIVTLTITAPSDGYVHLCANGSIQFASKTTDGFSEAIIGITDDNLPYTPIVGNDVRFYLNEDMAGAYTVPYGINAVFTVTAGSNNFYISACRYGIGDNNVHAVNNRLTATFIPNALP